MKRIAFAGMPGDSRFRWRGTLPFADGIPPSADVRYRQLKEQFSRSGNKGNLIIGESVGRLFEFDRTASCYVDLLDLLDAGWSVDRVSKEFAQCFDCVVFALANIIQQGMGAEHERLAAVVDGLNTEIIVLGVGMQEALVTDFRAIDRGTARLLQVLNAKAKVFGVRGTETEAWLHAMKLDRARALGCPSLYLYPRNISAIQVPEFHREASRVVTAGYLHNRDDRNRVLISLLCGCRADYVVQGELFRPTLKGAFGDESVFYNDITGELDKTIMSRVFGKVQSAPLPFSGYWYFQSPELWRSFCSRQDIYMGDRFHGGVAALQSGIPAIFLWGDLRVRELTEFFGLPKVSMADARKMTVENLVSECLTPENLEQFRQVYRTRFLNFKSAMQAAGLELAVDLALPDMESRPKGGFLQRLFGGR